MDWVVGLLSAVVAVYGFVAPLALIFRLRRREETEYGANAILCVTLAVFALMRINAAHHQGPTLSGERYATLLLVVAVTTIVDFVIDYTRPASPRRRTWLRTSYAVGCVLALLTMTADMHVGPKPLIGYEFGVVGLRLSTLGAILHLVLLVEVLGATWLLARAYLDGNRETLTGTMGSVALSSAFALDVAHGLGLGLSLSIGQFGFFAFVIGMCTAFTFRYVATATELERRSGELESLTSALRRSYQDLRVAQEELVRKEQLAVVGELAAVVAHEVRNPLAVISNAVAGLRKVTLSKDDQATLLEILDEETRRLNRLVSDLLRYARPVNVQRARVPLTDLLERPLALAQKANVDVARPSNLHDDVRLWGDAGLLRQVFDNLIENAVQAMGHGGTLTVQIDPRTEDGFDGLAIHIADTGEGMDTIVRNRAKDPFFTTRPSGTGLGLAIVDRIVEAHGGHLLIASRPGEGTTVTVCLPTAPPSELTAASVAPAADVSPVANAAVSVAASATTDTTVTAKDGAQSA